MNVIPPEGGRSRDINLAINQLIEGRSNATSEITLKTGAVFTLIERSTINANAGIWLFPKTASAAAEAATTYAYIDSAGLAVVIHANNAIADRTFHVLILGG